MHREVLTKPAAALFPLLSRFPDFYLAGGTALALQIGHRISVDFDLFNQREIDRHMFQHVQSVLGDAVEIEPLVNNGDELTILADGVKMTFLRYPFPVRDSLVLFERVRLLSVSEIATTKAYTIGRRGSFKDYVDLYFVIHENRSTLADIIAGAEQKFGTDFNSRLFLEQLVYVADLDEADVWFIKPKITRRAVQSFFEDRVREVARSI